MEPIQHALLLLKRQSELENAMRRPGGIRVTEERELYQLREALSRFPAAVTAILEAALRMRRPSIPSALRMLSLPKESPPTEVALVCPESRKGSERTLAALRLLIPQRSHWLSTSDEPAMDAHGE
jgi:hypothetical protein